MKTGLTLQELAAELERQAKAKKDYLAPTNKLEMAQDGTLSGLNGNAHGINKHAHGQLAERLGIPRIYYNRMKEENPTLLAANVNSWFQKKPERRLVRTLDGNVRGFLSARFRCLDNFDLAEPVLEKCMELGLTVESCQITETKFHIKAISHTVQGEVKKGQLVQAGVYVGNSEVGAGTVEVTPFGMVLACLNGMKMAMAGLRKYHVGKLAEQFEGAVELFTSATMKADNKAFFMKVRDVVAGAVNQHTFEKLLERMRHITGQEITGNPVEVVENLGSRFALNQDERGGILKHLITGADLTQWGLVNAITRTSQDITDYDRATDFEALGGDVMELDGAAWKSLAIAS